MAKGSSKATKSGPKAKAVKTAGKAKATPKAAASVVSEAAKRRQLNRRDTDVQIERAIGSKLDHVPKGVQMSKRNSKGQTILELVEQTIREKRPNNGKLGSKWWTATLAEFGYNKGAFEDMPAPADFDDSTLPNELLSALHSTYADNEVNATHLPFSQYMDDCAGLSSMATYGVLRAIQPSLEMPYRVAARCLAVFVPLN